jgi:secreted PhoX family phosphatase
MDMPDNVTSGPRGTLVVCEDGTRPMQRLLGLTPAGEVFVLAENAMVLEGSPNGLRGDFRRSEWAGAVFHDRWLFVNLLFPGVTFAITGPWERGPA